MKERNNKNENTYYIGYEEILTDNEILTYAHIIDRFKNDEINFDELKEQFLNHDIIIEPILYDYSTTKMTTAQAEIIEKRLSKQNYIYDDISKFILNSNEFKNIVFCLDYKAIEILANSGMPEYQNIMINILKTQLKYSSYSSSTDKKLNLERRKWKKRISELESQLTNSDKHNKLI